jgi:pyruvate/2-oxoglutarate dehydrogenase complex dihydrolipoamide dehydrogenase (E3) component
MLEATAGKLPPTTCDVCIIGAGSAGLNVAAGAAQLGADVILIERGKMGGECLNTGCVPSKSLIAAAHAAQLCQAGEQMGIGSGEKAQVDFRKVHDHILAVTAKIAPTDSRERFENLGVRVLKEEARFLNRSELVAGGQRIRARRFVVATGSRPAIPPVPGLAEIEPLTNETVFSLTERPEHLLVVGGGPIGLEVAQALRRLGSAITIIDRSHILPRDEPEAVDVARAFLRRAGIDLLETTELVAASRSGTRLRLAIEQAGIRRTIEGSHVLVAAGRTPTTEGLGLEQAGVAFGKKGIEVDARMRTSNRKIFAIGDVAEGPRFTHVAAYQAGIVVRNALFRLPAKVDYRALPWVTYVDPEIAHVGLTEAEAKTQHHDVQTIVEQLGENDRAQTERQTEGFLKLVLSSRGRVLGATIVAPHAGELIALWGLVISRRLPLSAVAGMIVPYPTLSELSKRAAGSYYKPRLFSTIPRLIVRAVQSILP